MSVKTKRQKHQSPESQPCPPYSIPNESNHSSSSVNTEVEPWIHPGWVRAPQDHIRPPGSDPVLMDASSGTRDSWAASRLPLSLWFVHLQVKTHTCTQKGYVQLGCDLVHDHTLKWPCFWWVVSHGGGRRQKGGGRCDDEIHWLSPDRLGTRPLIALDVMWMTSQDTEHRFITCSPPIIHHQANHWSWYTAQVYHKYHLSPDEILHQPLFLGFCNLELRWCSDPIVMNTELLHLTLLYVFHQSGCNTLQFCRARWWRNLTLQEMKK